MRIDCAAGPSPMMRSSWSWDDLRLALAIHRTGSLAGAARSLGVNHSTVFRRLNALEQEIGVRLFDRLATGYRATAAGEQMAEAAERMEQEALALDRELTGRDHQLAGSVRVTSSESLAFRLLTDHLAAFRQRHPGIIVELTIDNRMLSLSRREADVALRPVRPSQADLFGRKLAGVAWGLYGAVGRFADATGLDGCPLIGWEEGATQIRAAAWIRAAGQSDAIVYRSNSLINQLLAARAGIGLAVLPCYLADPEPALRRITAPIEELAGELWIVTHADLRKTARIRAFMEVVGDGLAGRRHAFEGDAV